MEAKYRVVAQELFEVEDLSDADGNPTPPDAEWNDAELKIYIRKAATQLWPEDEISDLAKDVIKELKVDLAEQFKKIKEDREGEGKESAPVGVVEEKKEVKKEKVKKEKKVVEKKVKEERDLSGSNKARIYLAWKAGENDIKILHSSVNEAVKENTIKSWISGWKKGQGLPAIARIK